MSYKNINIYIWLQKDINEIFKVITSSDNGIIKFYNENDELLMSRTGLSKKQVNNIEKKLLEMGAIKLNDKKTSFITLK